LFGLLIFVFPALARAEMKIFENKSYILNLTSYLRTDIVTLKNNIDLNSKNSDSASTYLGIDYSLGFDLKSKDSGTETFLKLERNGPYDYDAPIAIHNTLKTSTAQMERYRGSELLPGIEELWIDMPVDKLNIRAKPGLFTYQVGHGFSLNGEYENYGLHLYRESKYLKWGFYYCRPDLANKRLGPHIKQEKEQGIDYEHNKANFFATDVTFPLGENKIQPYLGVLLDDTNAKRVSTFSTPTHHDLLGTFGISWDTTFKNLSLEFEAARNFGKAKSSSGDFKDVEHTGYLIYTKASYDFKKASPHSRFVFASGNKVTTDMVEEGKTTLTSGKNRAFSVYSPLNTTLADSIFPNVDTVPLVAMGGGNGLNYGISRPGTFNDARLFENLILFNFGLNYNLTQKLTCAVDWWYLRCQQKGVGTFNGTFKKLSPDLGQEIDLSFNYALNDHISLSLLSGYFYPGNFYREKRDDTTGSLFTPFIRGDGEANSAYQLEFSLTFSF